MRIEPRYKVKCANIVTAAGAKLDWVQELRYLGVHFVASSKFKCSYDNAKKSFYRSFNAIYGHVGKSASEEVILSLVKSKCLPVLLYGCDACPLTATIRRSLEFSVTRTLMKVFRTKSNDVIEQCRTFFGFSTVQQLIKTRKLRFLQKYANNQNYFCKLFASGAERERSELLSV